MESHKKRPAGIACCGHTITELEKLALTIPMGTRSQLGDVFVKATISILNQGFYSLQDLCNEFHNCNNSHLISQQITPHPSIWLGTQRRLLTEDEVYVLERVKAAQRLNNPLDSLALILRQYGLWQDRHDYKFVLLDEGEERRVEIA